MQSFATLNDFLVATARQRIENQEFFNLWFQRGNGPCWNPSAGISEGWGRHARVMEATRSEFANLADASFLANELDLLPAFSNANGVCWHTPLVSFTVYDDGGAKSSGFIARLLGQDIPIEVIPCSEFLVFQGEDLVLGQDDNQNRCRVCDVVGDMRKRTLTEDEWKEYNALLSPIHPPHRPLYSRTAA